MKKNLLIVLGLLTVIVIVFVNTGKSNTNAGGYDVGSTAKDFSLKNVDGKMISLADYSDAKGFIVVFTCNTCPFAQMYEQRIEELNQAYASKGYPVIAINPNDVTKKPDDSFDAMMKRSDEKNYSFPYLYDESQAVATAFGATRTPHIYILSKESGKLKVAYIGAIDDNAKDAASVSTKYVEDAVDNLLAGKPIKTDFTKAVGCTIKWKES